MIDIIAATSLYEFLRQCNASPLEKLILDCGAGGDNPPLALFHQYGYRNYGIEIAERSMDKAKQFCRDKNMQLNICRADMRHIPFGNESFSFVYSYNAIFFMTKPDIQKSINEMMRVLKPGGLCFVNFRSVDNPNKFDFCAEAFVRRLLGSERFSEFEDDEADDYFGTCEILFKQKRFVDKLHDGKRHQQTMIDYIVVKPR